MKRILIYLTLFALLGFTWTANDNQKNVKNEPQIIWSTTPLTWDDFKGKMRKSDPYDAATLSAVSSSFSGDNSNLNFEVKAVFFPKGSKKKAKKKSVELLKHEQGHFDITEIFARKLRQTLQNKTYRNYKSIGKEVDKIYNKNNMAWRKFQNLYDKETDHSKNKAEQLEWNTKIQSQLKELDEYKSTNFTVDISYLK